jgi:CBS-domain-containing membrane protein
MGRRSDMKVSEIMTRDVQIISPEDSLQTAAQMMAVYDFGMVPVGENDRLVGMLTDRDITTRAVARGLSPASCKVGDVMSPEVNYVYDYETVEEAARSMSDLQVRRLPVLDRDKHLVGIVSLGDLAIADPEPAADALTSISQPEPFAN